MEQFNDLCRAIASGAPHNYTYNWGQNYIGITFDTYAHMWAFKKSQLYKDMKPYKVLTRYRLYLFYAR